MKSGQLHQRRISDEHSLRVCLDLGTLFAASIIISQWRSDLYQILSIKNISSGDGTSSLTLVNQRHYAAFGLDPIPFLFPPVNEFTLVQQIDPPTSRRALLFDSTHLIYAAKESVWRLGSIIDGT